MNKNKLFALMLSASFLICGCYGCAKDADKSNQSETSVSSSENSDGNDDYLNYSKSYPFWESDVMVEESVLLTERSDGTYGHLAYAPTEIISVKSSSLTTTYTEGVDFEISGTKISKKTGSWIPSIKEDVLKGINMPDGEGLSALDASSIGIRNGYEKLLYTESPYIFRKQIFVTYRYDKTQSAQLKPQYVGDGLSNSLTLLGTKQPLDIVVYGDSIATGCNSSGCKLQTIYTDSNSVYSGWGISPNGLSFSELFSNQLNAVYGSEITLHSAARGAMNSAWGAENAASRVVNTDEGYNPDLVLIHFGVNDCTGRMSDADFERNIVKIISDVRSASDKTVEFILIGSMWSNPYSTQAGIFTNYANVLSKISSETDGVVFVNVGAVHKALLDKKDYAEMTGNNINHPNDFLHRVYAMCLNSAVLGDKVK